MHAFRTSSSVLHQEMDQVVGLEMPLGVSLVETYFFVCFEYATVFVWGLDVRLSIRPIDHMGAARGVLLVFSMRMMIPYSTAA